MPTFVAQIAQEKGISLDCTLVLYLERKTKAADRGSKARRSLGNLYALYVLCEAYVDGHHNGTQFTTLLGRMKELPFGSKLQNHPLDNRLNDEVSRQYAVSEDMLPVQAASLGNGRKARKISVALLEDCDDDLMKAAEFVINVVDRYVQIITDNQTAYLDEIEAARTSDDIATVVSQAFVPTADARLFEVVSYALLHLHFLQERVTLTRDGVSEDLPLTLYRTGRTNANDGGIDFVLTPLGRFFQVTETLDFKKYFLDFEKVNRFKFTFVIKTDLSAAEVMRRIRADALSTYPKDKAEIYMELFDEIFTLTELRKILDEVKKSEFQIKRLQALIVESFKLEYGMLD